MGDDLDPAMNPAPSEQDVFAGALALEVPAARAAWLDVACAGEAGLRQRVEALLRAAEDAGDFLESPPDGLHDEKDDTLQVRELSEKPGDRIGRYKLLQQIGEGGCGVVYMAEQEEPVRRRVALKVIKLGMDTKSVIARFEAERQALALMDHPNIAKVLDAGATETGRPYFVMELVRGIKITDYCDQNHLSTAERLHLFVQVCHAIQHAHQKGIIHRDIKPSNILVTQNESMALPRVIDFGIAKATTGQQLADKTVFTAFEQFIGTPAYMSPEQAMMTSLDIDTRTDIYALGVLLYELLTGRTPFDAKELIAAGLEAMRRIIREQEPARPSTRLSTMLAADLTTVAQHRQAEPARLGTLLRGDLDWIVMKALEKDRTRRYETATGLAADIQRHLRSEPVMARPPGAAYRFQKLVRRNKLACTAVVAVALALLLGAAVSTWQAIRATRSEQEQSRLREQADAARHQAETEQRKSATEATRSRQVAQFLKDMLQGVGPSVARGRDTAMLKEILDHTAARVGRDLAGQPGVEADLRTTIGLVYRDLGEFKNSEDMLREALAIGRRLLGQSHPAVAGALDNLGRALHAHGKFGEAEAVHREALALRVKLHGDEHLEVASSLNNLGNALRARGSLTEAEDLHRQALALRRKLLSPEHLAVAASLKSLALTIVRLGKLEESEHLHREALALRKKLLGGENLEVADSMDAVAGTLERQRRLPEAAALFRESIALRRKLDPGHPGLAKSLIFLANLLDLEEKLDEAEALYREARAICLQRASAEHPEVAQYAGRFGLLLCRQGKPAEAETLFREVIAQLERTTAWLGEPEYWQQLGRIHNDLGILLGNTGREAGEKIHLEKAAAIRRAQPQEAWIERAKQKAAAEPEDAGRWHILGDAHLAAGEWQEAIAAYNIRDRKGGSAWQWFPLAIAHRQLGHRGEARAWFDKALDWMDSRQETQLRRRQAEAAVTLGVPDPWSRCQEARRHLQQGDAFRQQGDAAQAKAAYGEAANIYQTLAADFPNVPAYSDRVSKLRPVNEPPPGSP